MRKLSRRGTIAGMWSMTISGCVGTITDRPSGITLGEIIIQNAFEEEIRFQIEIRRDEDLVHEQNLTLESGTSELLNPNLSSDRAEYVIEATTSDGQRSTNIFSDDQTGVETGDCRVVHIVVTPYGKLGVLGSEPIDETGCSSD